MKYSENKNIDRRGCLIVLLIPLILIGGYYAWAYYIMMQFGNSIKETTEKINEQRIEKNKKRDLELVYTQILTNNQRSTFTGIEKRNEITYTNALLIETLDSFSLKYKVESLENWKSKDDLEGIARLDKSSIGSWRWKIEDAEGNFKPAFRFIGEKGECQLEILISKEKYVNSLIAIIKENCKGETKFITPIMNYK